MNKKADPYTRTSFGRFLQKARIENGISLMELARQTRIRTQILSAIEKEEHENLPAESFVRGMITAFAKVVGADINEAIRLYKVDRTAYEELERLEDSLKKSKRGGWLKLVFALGLLCGLVGVTVFGFNFLNQKLQTPTKDTMPTDNLVSSEVNNSSLNKAVDKPVHNGIKANKNPIKSDDKSQKNPGTGGTNYQTIKKEAPERQKNKNTPERSEPVLPMDGYVLSIHAIKNTWVKVIADGKEAVKYRLKIEDRLDLTAKSRFNLLIGDADGVRLTLNGRPLMVNGKSGQIVNIEVP